MKCNQRLPASTLEQQVAINQLLARPLNFSKTKCKKCGEYNDDFLTTDDEVCFTCAVDEHFEKLKSS